MAMAKVEDQRAFLLDCVKRFKRGWVELAEALVRVREAEAYRHWGFGSFDEYVTRELRLKRGTVDKLCASYGFLRTNAPRLLRVEDAPSWQAVDFVARAEERGAAPAEVMEEMKRAAFDDGAPAPTLSRRYGEVAFPMDDGEKRARLVAQILGAGRRLADLVADPDAGLPRGLGERVESVIGELVEWGRVNVDSS